MVVIKDLAIYAPDKRWTDAFGTARVLLSGQLDWNLQIHYICWDGQNYTTKLQWKSFHCLVDMICWRINDTEWLQTGKFYVMLIGMNTCFHTHYYTLTTQATYICNFSSDNNLITFHYWNSWGISSSLIYKNEKPLQGINWCTVCYMQIMCIPRKLYCLQCACIGLGTHFLRSEALRCCYIHSVDSSEKLIQLWDFPR